jgi:hypothetical protein
MFDSARHVVPAQSWLVGFQKKKYSPDGEGKERNNNQNRGSF